MHTIKNPFKVPVVAEICLYGDRTWIAAVNPAVKECNLLPSEKAAGSFTEAVFAAQAALQEVLGREENGLVAVYEPTGKDCALIRLAECSYYGNLSWQPAPQLVVDLN